MMRDKLALLPGNGPTHHRVFIRLVAWGYTNYRIAEKFGGGKVTLFEPLAKESLAN